MRRFPQHENVGLASDLEVRCAVNERLVDNLDESRADYISTHQLSEYSVGDVVGPLFDRYEPRILLVCGSLGSFTSYILLAQCSEYWHFMLCLGVLGGVSAAIITTVSIAVLSHCICMGGSSAGAIRAIAFIALGCYTFGFALVKGRLPASTQSRTTIDPRAFKSPGLCFQAVGVFSFESIFFRCAALLPIYICYAGLSLDAQFYSLTVLNAMSFLGRVLPGFAADLVGRFNMLLSLVIMTLIAMAAVWLPFRSRDDATLYAVVAIFGFGSGGWLSLAPVCTGQLCKREEYGRFYGTIYCVAAFGVLLAVPAGGELIQSTTPQVLVGVYSAVLLTGLVSIALSRWALLDWKWRWNVKV
ncbi:major facilitator superfamily domain-containing protein [Aspergillus pseudotamarii]|uniref:Major facilitator superfamily domain-containing protein n=1 Tax=Aspergillus pseudotamarii TaxID=132259 RepID=A0A5N6T0I8_ASPPS|nr:major facilitator superfamily domain-containing protein [Aspergillus pseudotamarii]KAE8139054.1 major facilitator superfamily domain-containing protein [Aspergillus pseudotamarii]